MQRTVKWGLLQLSGEQRRARQLFMEVGDERLRRFHGVHDGQRYSRQFLSVTRETGTRAGNYAPRGILAFAAPRHVILIKIFFVT